MFIVSLLVIIAAVICVARGTEVRVTLFLAAILLGLLSGNPAPIIREFLTTLSNEKFVVPICSAMGFAYVLRHTGCDQHLVRLLMAPVRRVKWLAIPGVIIVGFIVNIPIISQTSTAVCIGPVVVPLLRALGYRAATIGACLLLGASMGGELLNPGAPELLTVSAKTKKDTRELIPYLVPLLLPYAAIATGIFWIWSAYRDKSAHAEPQPEAKDAVEKINFFKALIPVVPLIFLFVTGPPTYFLPVAQKWLIPYPDETTSQAIVGGPAAIASESKQDSRSGSRLIGLAMLVGVAAASLASPKHAMASMKEFFNGAGYGFTHIISLIVVANAFGKGIEQAGLAQILGDLIKQNQGLLMPLAAAVPWLFAMVCGSGMATAQSLFGFFYLPAVEANVDPNGVGAIVSVSSAAGRTMSPVAAVVLMCATLSGAKPWELIRLVGPPLIMAVALTVLLRMFGIV